MRSTIPRIPHLPGSHIGPDDLVLSPDEARLFLERPAIVVEKTDGVSLTVRRAATGELRAGLKSDWLRALGGRMLRAADLWVRIHEDRLSALVGDDTHLYGEWLWHRLRIPYQRLPSAALLYGMRDRHGQLVPRMKVLEKLRRAGVPIVSPLFRGVIGDRALSSLCTTSQWGGGRSEGLVVEIEVRGEVRWAKWVRADYHQPRARDLTGEKNGVTRAALNASSPSLRGRG